MEKQYREITKDCSRYYCDVTWASLRPSSPVCKFIVLFCVATEKASKHYWGTYFPAGNFGTYVLDCLKETQIYIHFLFSSTLEWQTCAGVQTRVVNTKSDGDLGMQGARASAAVVLNHFLRSTTASVTKGSMGVAGIIASRHSVKMPHISLSPRHLLERHDDLIFDGCWTSATRIVLIFVPQLWHIEVSI